MSGIEEYRNIEHDAAMMAIKDIADGQYEKAMGHLADAIQAKSAKSVLLVQELCKAAEESESNV